MASASKNTSSKSPAFQHAILFVRPRSNAAARARTDVISCLNQAGTEFSEATDVAGQEFDLGIAIGGDGSMLHAARTALEMNIPLIGINTGRFGFLADINAAEIGSVLPTVLAGQFLTERRLTAQVTVTREGKVVTQSEVVNETTVQKQQASRLCELEVRIDGNFLLSQRGDGIIISTPTGSTAYALACNGPIVHPALNIFTLVPISPHQLAYRPFSFGAEHSVEIKTLSQEDAAVLTTDGINIHTMDHNDTVNFKVSERALQIIHPVNYDYFRILREKLKWGSSLC